MTRPTSYDLLKDINDSINRLEDKMDKRISCIENDVEEIKGWKSNLMGKISIIGAIVGGAMGIATSVVTALITKKL